MAFALFACVCRVATAAFNPTGKNVGMEAAMHVAWPPVFHAKKSVVGNSRFQNKNICHRTAGALTRGSGD